jgi:hypothetical protein
LHAESQQKPSTHVPFWQSVPTLHDAPIGRAGVHWCVLGLQFGAAALQSALVVHDARQAVCAALQLRPSGHAPGIAGPQAPIPSHTRAGVSVLPVQVCGAHDTVEAANTHAAADSVMSLHWAPHVVPVPAQAARVPCGGPDATGEQVPRLAAMSHASHCPEQATLQQNPSTQNKPSAHCVPAEHAEPRPRPGAPPVPIIAPPTPMIAPPTPIVAPPVPALPPTPVVPPVPIMAPPEPVRPAPPLVPPVPTWPAVPIPPAAPFMPPAPPGVPPLPPTIVPPCPPEPTIAPPLPLTPAVPEEPAPPTTDPPAPVWPPPPPDPSV